MFLSVYIYIYMCIQIDRYIVELFRLFERGTIETCFAYWGVVLETCSYMLTELFRFFGVSDDKTMPCLMGSVLENMFVYIDRTVSPIRLGLGLALGVGVTPTLLLLVSWSCSPAPTLLFLRSDSYSLCP